MEDTCCKCLCLHGEVLHGVNKVHCNFLWAAFYFTDTNSSSRFCQLFVFMLLLNLFTRLLISADNQNSADTLQVPNPQVSSGGNPKTLQAAISFNCYLSKFYFLRYALEFINFSHHYDKISEKINPIKKGTLMA